MSILYYLFLLYFLLITPKAYANEDSNETPVDQAPTSVEKPKEPQGDSISLGTPSDNATSVDNSNNANESTQAKESKKLSGEEVTKKPHKHLPYEGPPGFQFGSDLVISGQVVNNVIVGKRPKYKILASIRIMDSYNTGEYTHRCLGVLITSTVVVTVAHCVHDQFGNFILKPATYRIAFGNNLLADAAKTVPVSQVKYHKSYLIESKLNDIALFKLAQAQTILTPDLYYLRPENHPNTTECTLYSWIFSEEHGNKTLAFSSLNVKIQPKTDCYLEIGSSQSYISPVHKCFLIPEAIHCACLYNSGAPIICQDILVGIFSYAATAQQSEIVGQLAVYVNVGNYIDFIERFISPGRAPTLKRCWISIYIGYIAMFIL